MFVSKSKYLNGLQYRKLLWFYSAQVASVACARGGNKLIR
jgi:hypothetical protein